LLRMGSTIGRSRARRRRSSEKDSRRRVGTREFARFKAPRHGKRRPSVPVRRKQQGNGCDHADGAGRATGETEMWRGFAFIFPALLLVAVSVSCGFGAMSMMRVPVIFIRRKREMRRARRAL